MNLPTSGRRRTVRRRAIAALASVAALPLTFVPNLTWAAEDAPAPAAVKADLPASPSATNEATVTPSLEATAPETTPLAEEVKEVAPAAEKADVSLLPMALDQNRSHTIVVNKGDLRTGTTAGNAENGYNISQEYTEGARFGLFDTEGGATPVATCEIETAGGPCTFSNVQRSGKHWVRELAPVDGSQADDNYSALVSQLTTGSTKDGFVTRTYQYQVELSSSSNQTYTVPSAPNNTNAWGSSSGSFVNVVKNPLLTQTCDAGLDIGLVIDLSGSVVPNRDTALEAQDGFFDALAGTGSNLSLYSFGNVSPRKGTENVGPFNVDDPDDVAEFKANTKKYWDQTVLGQGTNWDAGLWAASQGPAYDLVIVLTDGNPTYSGMNSAGTSELHGSGSLTSFRELERAMASANVIKDNGSRLIVFGIGEPGEVSTHNLAAVSGPTGWETGSKVGSLNDFDYTTASWAELNALLKDFAKSIACTSDVGVTKLVQADGATSAVPAADWDFTLGVEGEGISVDGDATQTTDAEGRAGWTVKYASPTGGELTLVNLAETAKDGWTLDSVSCTVDGDAVDAAIDDDGRSVTLSDLSLGIGSDVQCTFTNREGAPSWTLEKTSDPISGTVVVPGQKVTYTLTATNPSDVDATGVEIADDLSNVFDKATYGEDAKASSGTVTVAGDTLTWTGTVPAKGKVSITYSVTVKADAAGTLKNVVTGTGVVPPEDCPEADPDCRTTKHPVTTPGFEITKTADPAPGTAVAPGQQVTYTVTGTNTGETALSPVIIADDMSKVLSNATYNFDATATVGDDEEGEFVFANDTLTWRGELGVGESVKITYSVRVDADLEAGVLIENAVTGSATPQIPEDPEEPCDETANPCTPGEPIEPPEVNTEHPVKVPGMTLTKTADPADGTSVAPGQTIAYTISAENTGETLLRPATVADDLSKVLKYATYVADSAKAEIDGEPAGTLDLDAEKAKLTWEGELRIGKKVEISYSVTVKPGTEGKLLNNVASATGTPQFPKPPVGPEDKPDPDCVVVEGVAPCLPGTELVPPPVETEHPIPVPGFELTKVSDPADGSTVLPGDSITYTVTGANTGTTSLSPVTVTDDLSDVLAHAALEGDVLATVWTNDSPAEPVVLKVVDDTVTWTGTLAQHQRVVITYTVTLNQDALGVRLRNVATATVPKPCVPTEDQPCEPIEVPPVKTEHDTPSWTLAKTSNPASGSKVEPGSTITYTLTAKNTSKADVKNVEIVDDLSRVLNNATFVEGSISPSAGVAALTGETLTWSLDVLPAGETETLTYQVKVKAGAYKVTLRNVVTGGGQVPPAECTPAEPCGTEHETPERPTPPPVTPTPTDPPVDPTPTPTDPPVDPTPTPTDPPTVVDPTSPPTTVDPTSPPTGVQPTEPGKPGKPGLPDTGAVLGGSFLVLALGLIGLGGGALVLSGRRAREDSDA